MADERAPRDVAPCGVGVAPQEVARYDVAPQCDAVLQRGAGLREALPRGAGLRAVLPRGVAPRRVLRQLKVVQKAA